MTPRSLSGPNADVAWFWSFATYVEPRSGLRTSGMTESLDGAKAEFRDSFEKWRAWAAKTGIQFCRGLTLADPNPRRA